MTDPTAALRVRRFRAKKKLNGTNAVFTVGRDPARAISTSEMCALAARLGAGLATAAEQQLAERLIMALVNWLPPDSILKL